MLRFIQAKHHTGSAANSNKSMMVSLGLLLGVDKTPTSKSGVSSSQEYIQQLNEYINRGEIDIQAFHQTCLDSTAFVLSRTGLDSSPRDEGLFEVINLLCWCPAHIMTHSAMETGVYVWKLLVAAAPWLGSLVVEKLVDAWLWTIDNKRGLFACGTRDSGPAAKLRPHLSPGVPELPPERDPVEGIIAHKIWIGFFADRFEQVTPHGSVEQLMHIGRLLQITMEFDAAGIGTSHFSRHPNAAGTFFNVMLLGLKFSSWQRLAKLEDLSLDYNLLEDQIYRASFCWFMNRPGFHDANYNNFAKDEAQSVLLFTQFLLNGNGDSSPKGGEKTSANPLYNLKDHHPVWCKMDSYANEREKRKQLLIILCHHEADRLDVWANPTKARKNMFYRLKLNSHKGMEYKFCQLKYSSEKWIEFAKTAFSVDPRIAFSLVSRYPSVSCLKAEVTQLVQSHTTEIHNVPEIRNVPEMLPYLFTPEAVQENSTLLEQLPHWAACSVTQALTFLTPAYASNPHVKAYVLRVLDSYSPDSVTRFLSQLVQALRYGDEKLLLQIAQRSTVCSHMLIWHVQAEICCAELGKQTRPKKRDWYICCLIAREQNSSFQDRLHIVKQRIIDGLTPDARDLFQRESDFLDKITSISGLLVQFPKEDRRAVIRRELEKIELNGDDLYLPIAPSKLIRSIQLDSGTPLQSATRVPIMITFNVVDRDDDQVDLKPQACIFKVGDDCRQDVLALQVISLLRDIFEAMGIDLYLFPYGVLPTGPQRGIIEVVPNTRSRSQMGESNNGDLFEIFQHRFGPVGSLSFETARGNFIRSSAGYAVASLLLQLKDRHNGNLLFDNTGRLVHIDFGYIFGNSPGGNMHFENAQFKLSHDMTRLLDPSGSKKSETWMHFVSLCVKGYLAARLYMDELINTVQLMIDSGLPCFSRGDPIGNFRKRFHPEMSERQAATFMIRACEDAYNKWTTALYDSIQYWQNGIKK